MSACQYAELKRSKGDMSFDCIRAEEVEFKHYMLCDHGPKCGDSKLTMSSEHHLSMLAYVQQPRSVSDQVCKYIIEPPIES